MTSKKNHSIKHSPLKLIIPSLIMFNYPSLGLSAETLNANPAATKLPTPTYSRAPMAAYNFMMDDALLGNNYEKPVWNVHDTIGLPKWLSFGVEQRTRYESLSDAFKGSQKGVQSQGGDQQIALQTDFWLQAKFNKFRVAMELMDARTVGSDINTGKTPNTTNYTPFPSNNASADTWDFAQGYASWADQNVLNSGYGAEIKVGRQTMDLGSRRLVARPIFRNTVNNFTGLRARVMAYDKWQFNTFATVPVVRYPNYNSVTPNPNLLNNTKWDEEDFNTWFSGGIFEYTNLYKDINAEVALYHLSEGDNPLNPTRNRNYLTPTIRFYQKPSKGKFDFQAEGMGQFGTVRYAATNPTTGHTNYANTTQLHEAWSSHVEAGYSFELPWSPRFYLEYDYASGSSHWKNHDSSGIDGRFDSLYGASDFDFGPTGIYGAFQRSNINSPGYKLELSPTKDLSFKLQQRLVWLASANDCWGGNTCTAATTPALVDGKSSFVGDQLGFTGRYNVNSSLNFDAGWYHLFKGEFAKSAHTTKNTGTYLTGVTPPPGADTDYFFIQSQLRF